jgi:hypothetical protein
MGLNFNHYTNRSLRLPADLITQPGVWFTWCSVWKERIVELLRAVALIINVTSQIKVVCMRVDPGPVCIHHATYKQSPLPCEDAIVAFFLSGCYHGCV